MPGMSGLELAERLSPLRALFISGYSAEAATSGGLPPGSALLQKPFDHCRAADRSSRPAGPPGAYDLKMIDETTDLGAQVARHLREDRVAWLTTVTPGGAPLPSPVWFWWDGADSVLVFSLPDTARTRNIEANPKVSLNFEGDGSGGDIVILSGDRVDRGPTAAPTASTPTCASTRGASSACGSRPRSSRSATRSRCGSA